MFTTRPRGGAINRAEGLHALRHFSASALHDAAESIKALAEYLGRADRPVTLGVSTSVIVWGHPTRSHAFDKECDGQHHDTERPDGPA